MRAVRRLYDEHCLTPRDGSCRERLFMLLYSVEEPMHDETLRNFLIMLMGTTPWDDGEWDCLRRARCCLRAGETRKEVSECLRRLCYRPGASMPRPGAPVVSIALMGARGAGKTAYIRRIGSVRWLSYATPAIDPVRVKLLEIPETDAGPADIGGVITLTACDSDDPLSRDRLVAARARLGMTCPQVDVCTKCDLLECAPPNGFHLSARESSTWSLCRPIAALLGMILREPKAPTFTIVVCKEAPAKPSLTILAED